VTSPFGLVDLALQYILYFGRGSHMRKAIRSRQTAQTQGAGVLGSYQQLRRPPFWERGMHTGYRWESQKKSDQ
jgi:hypothetical protein